MFRVAILAVAFIAPIASARAIALLPFAQGTSPKKAEPATDRAKVVADINANLEDAVKHLHQNDAGADTIRKQQRIVDLLKELLNDPPANNSNSPPPPLNPSSRSQDPKPSASVPTPSPMKSQANVAPPGKATDSQPTPAKVPSNEAIPGMPKVAPAEKSGNPKAYDGRWGDYRLRPPEMIDAVGRDRFMPRYEELLRDYYRAIAESDRRTKAGN